MTENASSSPFGLSRMAYSEQQESAGRDLARSCRRAWRPTPRLGLPLLGSVHAAFLVCAPPKRRQARPPSCPPPHRLACVGNSHRAMENLGKREEREKLKAWRAGWRGLSLPHPYRHHGGSISSLSRMRCVTRSALLPVDILYYMYTCICMYVCMYVCVYIYIYD